MWHNFGKIDFFWIVGPERGQFKGNLGTFWARKRLLRAIFRLETYIMGSLDMENGFLGGK